jgi:Trypsin-like peptidase domain
MSSIRVVICLLACSFAAGCGRTTSSTQVQVEEARSEPWAGQPPAEWPQLVLTNSATFNGHSSLNGASAFLIRATDGRIVAATALHLLGPNGGVEPTIAPERLPAVLSSWRMYPRTKPNATILVTGLGYDVTPRKNFDWLILSVASKSGELPATPLTLRPKPVSIGDAVFLVGVPYSESDRAQNVYRGRVTERAHADFFRFTIDPPVDIRGFSGAPILDQRGLVVGVMTVWFKPTMQGDRFLEAGGEDAASVVHQIAGKR